jgi:hypothetical protein
LSGASELAEHSTLGSKVKVGILKHNERSVATELQAQLLQGTSSKLGKVLANTGRTSERDLLNQRVGSKLSSSLAVTSGKNLDGGRRKTGFNGELSESEGGVGSLGRRLNDDRATGSQSGSDLSSDHGGGEVPGCDDATDTNGFTDGHEGGVRGGRRDRDAVGSSGLFGEP